MRQAALDAVFELAKIDKRVVFLGSDLGAGTLDSMQSELPGQFFMEGISEQHLIGFAAGLAKDGFIPFVHTISNFMTRRAYEQISIDLSLHNLPVRLLGAGGGMVYAPLGPTHTAIEDLALMSAIPGMRVFAPADANEMQSLLYASLIEGSPWYVRFGKGDEPNVTEKMQINPWQPKYFGNSETKVLILCTGILVHQALKAVKMEPDRISELVSIVHLPEITNLNEDSWWSYLEQAEHILVLEEHIPRGGLLTRLLHLFHERCFDGRKVIHKSLRMEFPHKYGSQSDHMAFNGLDSRSIRDLLNRLLGF